MLKNNERYVFFQANLNCSIVLLNMFSSRNFHFAAHLDILLWLWRFELDGCNQSGERMCLVSLRFPFHPTARCEIRDAQRWLQVTPGFKPGMSKAWFKSRGANSRDQPLAEIVSDPAPLTSGQKAVGSSWTPFETAWISVWLLVLLDFPDPPPRAQSRNP